MREIAEREITNEDMARRRGALAATDIAASQAQAFDRAQQARNASDESSEDEEEKKPPPEKDAQPAAKLPRPSDLEGTVRMIERVLASSSRLDAAYSAAPITRSGVPDTKSVGFDLMGTLTKRISDTLSFGSAGSPPKTEYEKKWEVAMQQYSPQAQYQERVRKITFEVQEFSRKCRQGS